MQVGNASSFAIEWQVTRRDNLQVHGHFCFWAMGKRIGNYDDEMILSSSEKYLVEFLSYSHMRSIYSLNGKTKEEIFAYVYDTGIISPKPGETLEDASKRYDKLVPIDLQNDFTLHDHLRTTFHLNDVGDSAFDWISIILINDTLLGKERLIWREWTTWQLFEANLASQEFEKVAQQFLILYTNEV